MPINKKKHQYSHEHNVLYKIKLRGGGRGRAFHFMICKEIQFNLLYFRTVVLTLQLTFLLPFSQLALYIWNCELKQFSRMHVIALLRDLINQSTLISR